MKKAVLIAAALAVWFLARLPHPARDIAMLKPVRVVYVCTRGELLSLETDTGDAGSGRSLTEAAEDLRRRSDGEIFLDTAEFLLLAPEVELAPDFYTHLRPGCKVERIQSPPDLEAAGKYLSAHPPKETLRTLRQRGERSRHESPKAAYPLAPGGNGCAAGPFCPLGLASGPRSGAGCSAPDPDP